MPSTYPAPQLSARSRIGNLDSAVRQGCRRALISHTLKREIEDMAHRRALLAGALTASLLVPSTAFGLDEVNSKKLRDGVTVNGILQHERALQAVANANGGTRASGT